MSTAQKAVAFPPVSPQAHVIHKTSAQNTTRRRRKSSSLGDPRGDTGAGAITTNLPHSAQQQPESPTSPTIASKTPEKAPRERKRKKAKKLFNRWKRMSLRHTWVNPLILILVLLAAYSISPGEQNPLHHALFLSYADPPLSERTRTLPAHIGDVTQYGKGPKDFAFVAFYTLVLTFTREFLMQRLIRPIAVRCGIRNRAKQSRFMEQFYTAIYFGILGPFGLYVMSRSPVWYFNTAGMYDGFPHRAHEAYFKAYYLLQAAYWAQQALVLMLQLEKPRKDFRELVLHHIITLALIGLSYRFHFTYMGVAVYITHDISDFFLATSKTLNYLDSVVTIPYFVFFMGVWAYLRHYINLVILSSMLPPIIAGFDLRNIFGSSTGDFATVGSFTLDWETQQYKCWISQIITFCLLASLQAVNIFWFYLIVRILYRYLKTGEEKDERSEDEEEMEDVVEAAPEVGKLNGTNGHAVQPQIALNGEPISPREAPATGVEMKGGKDVVKRKR